MLDISQTFAQFPMLETERCLLRELTLNDSQDLFALVRDEAVTRYLPWETATTLDEAEQRIQRYLKHFEEQTAIVWGIENKSNQRLIGICLLLRFALADHRTELGYALGKQWWGQGFASEATRAVVEYGFRGMNFHSMEAHISPANIGSQKVLEKLGFVQEAYFRENYYDANLDTFEDTAVFSLLKSVWCK